MVWNSNPFLWRELRYRIGKRLSFIIFLPVAFYIALALTYAVSSYDKQLLCEVIDYSYLGLMALIFLGGGVAGAGAFTAEKEGGKWDLLLVAPLRAEKMVWAKYAGSWVGMAPFAFTTLLIAVFETAFEGTEAVPLFLLAAATLAFGGCMIAVGLWFSLRAGTTRRSYFLTILVGVHLLVGIPLVLWCCAMVLGREDIFTVGVGLTHPVVPWEVAMRSPRMWFLAAFGEDGRMMQSLAYVVAQIALYAGAALVLVGCTYVALKRKVRTGGAA